MAIQLYDDIRHRVSQEKLHMILDFYERFPQTKWKVKFSMDKFRKKISKSSKQMPIWPFCVFVFDQALLQWFDPTV